MKLFGIIEGRRGKALLLTAAAVLVIGVFRFIAGPAAVQAGGEQKPIKQFHLYATDGYLTLPDGKQVYIWGYSLENKQGTAVFPAPKLEVTEGDEVKVTLTNIGPKKAGIKRMAHTIHFHGLDVNQANDGVPHTSEPIQVGGSFTYSFTATHAGTYFYHCHVDTVEHLQMGMFGAFIVKAKDGDKAWTGGPAYNKEYAFVLNEIDPVWHEAVEEGKPYDRTAFHPRYWTINGKAYPDTEKDPDTMIEGKVGETVLIRLINAGYQEHSFHMHGHHFLIVASDGRPLPEPMEKDTVNVAPGERYDLLVTFTQSGMYPFHSHNIVDNTNDGVYPGGLHTMIEVMPKDDMAKTIRLKAGRTSAIVDGRTVSLNPAPVVVKGRTLVPLRFIGGELGASVAWNGKDRSVTYTTHNTTIQLWIDKSRAIVNRKEVLLDSPPVIVNSSTMVPLRFVAENLGAKVSYDAVKAEVTIVADSASGNTAGPFGHEDGGADPAHDGHMPEGSGGSNDGASGMPSDDSSDGTNGSSTSGSTGGVVVLMENSVYSVKELKVPKGTKVTWVNKDRMIHTVTDLGNQFDSGNMGAGGEWSYTFHQPGTFTYYCTVHPGMTAKIIVTP